MGGGVFGKPGDPWQSVAREGDGEAEETEALPPARTPFSRKDLQATRATRTKFEARVMEPQDQFFLERFRRRKVASMPWTASTNAEWEKDLVTTKKDLMSRQRAAKFLAKPLCHTTHALKRTNSSSSSSSSTSSSSSSAPEAICLPATAPAPGTGSSTAAASSESRGASVPWVQPRGGKIHYRIDLPDGLAAVCKPHITLALGAATGDWVGEAKANLVCRLCKVHFEWR